jgi:RNA polymerase sigma factor (sigma-70 family)
MPTNRLTSALEHFQQALAAPEGPAATDAQLLARFVAGRDEAAFAALVRRHGRMVLGVCRRLLGNPHDAEDAFQATFLVLVRRAGSVRKREAVGSWLYGVAYRTAREARLMRARRRQREVQVESLPHPEVTPDELQDWRPLLDRELVGLPEKYRAPLLLCDLGGKGRKEVARELGLPEGTLSSRLATARQLLARRLARVGLALPGGLLAVALAPTRAPAGVPAALFHSTTRTALLVAAGKATLAGAVPAQVAALTEGVLKAMMLVKLKTAAAVLFGMAAVGIATGGLYYQARADAAGGPQLVAQDEGEGNRPAKLKQKEQRRSAEDALARERALREELEAARREAEAARAEALKMRDQAEAERQRAEAALREAKEQLARVHEAERAARVDAEKAYSDAVAQRGQRYAQEKAPQQPDAKQFMLEIDRQAEDMRMKFAQARKELQERLARLDEMEKRSMSELDQKRAEMMRRVAPRGTEKAPQARDKLDLILERLAQMEQRLDRLERNRR